MDPSVAWSCGVYTAHYGSLGRPLISQLSFGICKLKGDSPCSAIQGLNEVMHGEVWHSTDLLMVLVCVDVPPLATPPSFLPSFLSDFLCSGQCLGPSAGWSLTAFVLCLSSPPPRSHTLHLWSPQLS